MTKKFILAILVIALACGLVLTLSINLKKGTVYNESKNKWYITIQQAINDAAEGDKIKIYPGVYKENIVINKSLVIEGYERDSVIIEQGTRSVIALRMISNNATVRNLTIRNSHFGIYIFYTRRNSIVNVKIINCELAIMIRHSNETLVKNNVIMNAACVGIEIYHSSSNVLIGNKIINTTGDYGGIFITYSSNNEIKANFIANNTYGIIVYSSFDNLIYNNNFINNSKQCNSQVSINKWDSGYPLGGNYWSDYSGSDTDNDGIGDTPYIINEENKDRYPLVKPYSGIDPLYADSAPN